MRQCLVHSCCVLNTVPFRGSLVSALTHSPCLFRSRPPPLLARHDMLVALQGIISFALIYGIISILQFAVAAVLLLVHFLLCCTASIGVIWQTDFRTHCRLLVRGVARHAQQLWAQFWPLLILLSFVKTGTAYWPVVVFLWAYLACCWVSALTTFCCTAGAMSLSSLIMHVACCCAGNMERV